LRAAQPKDPETVNLPHTFHTFPPPDLGLAHRDCYHPAMAAGYTYILGSTTGTLYIGVTSDLDKRLHQHKNGTFEGFSKTYGCTRLLYFEHHDDVRTSIAREKQLKGWHREKKLILIRTTNPDFTDLAETWGWKMIAANEKMNR
jgi:putative endonuclease